MPIVSAFVSIIRRSTNITLSSRGVGRTGCAARTNRQTGAPCLVHSVRLAGAGVVRQQEAQRLTRQHLAVDSGYLVWERLDLGSALTAR
jgi:hypothetical protein